MADIAFVFGWQLPHLDGLSVAELMQWRTRAARRHNPEDNPRG